MSQYDTTQFYIVRANSQRRRDETAASPPTAAAAAAGGASGGGREPADLVLESTVGYQEYNDGVSLLWHFSLLCCC